MVGEATAPPASNNDSYLSSTDLFSHRFDAHSVLYVQYAILREDLIRKNLNNVYFKRTKIKNNTDIEKILEKIKQKFNFGHYICEDDQFFLLSNDENIFFIEDRKRQYDDCYEKEVVIEKEKREIHLDFTTTNEGLYKNLRTVLESLGFFVLEDFGTETGGIPVTFAFPGRQGLQYKTHSFDTVKFDDVKKNYDVKVVKQVEKLFKQIKKENHGIIILYGKSGTGKTFLVRSIASEIKNRRVVICVPPMMFLENAGLLNEAALNFSKTLLVFEDVGDVLVVEGAVSHVNSRANLLNMSDGLMSLLADCIIIVTFNHDISKIDPAILRSGRCIANIEVGILKYEQAQELVEFKIPKREYSLAEVYVMKNTGQPLEKSEDEKKMGFGV